MLSNIDYEKVDPGLLNIIQMLNSMGNMVSTESASVPETAAFINAIDDYRNAVALAIEQQGKRS